MKEPLNNTSYHQELHYRACSFGAWRCCHPSGYLKIAIGPLPRRLPTTSSLAGLLRRLLRASRHSALPSTSPKFLRRNSPILIGTWYKPAPRQEVTPFPFLSGRLARRGKGTALIRHVLDIPVHEMPHPEKTLMKPALPYRLFQNPAQDIESRLRGIGRIHGGCSRKGRSIGADRRCSRLICRSG
jgi:hypothetical protein